MSAIAGKPQRSRRGRVLIVGPVATAHADLFETFAQPPVLLGSMFEALGEVASSGAQDPVAAVILAEEFARSPHHRAIESLRRIDPSVRIIAVLRSAESAPDSTGASGPDAWLSGAFRIEELRRALDDDGLLASATKPAGTAASATSPAPAAPAPVPSVDHSSRAATKPFRATDTAPVFDLDAPIAPVPERTVDAVTPSATASATPKAPAASSSAPTGLDTLALPASASPSGATVPSNVAAGGSAARDPQAPPVQTAPSIAAPPTPITAVGDTDLLHALLHDPTGMLPLALRLIAHHGGWNNVRVITDDASIDAGVEIVASGQRFGRLLADGAPPGRLRPWADWLGHWLHMQREHARLRELCATDDLTGARNRRFFHSFLEQAIARARHDRRPVTVMVFDIDNFKPYNDRFGHEAGDDILCEIVRLLRSIVRQGDVVCRIGGDEFVVVFADPEAPRTPGSKHPETIESIARRIHQAVNSMRFPKLGVEAPGTLSISAGLATYPWDGHDSATLLRHADQRALESKRRGKNAITLGPTAVDG